MAVFVVTTLSDEAFGGGETVGSPDGAGLSIREAMGLSASGDIVRFNNGLAGGTSVLSGAPVNINHSVTFDGDTNNDGSPDITVKHNTVLLSLGTAGTSFTNDGVRFFLDRSAAGNGASYALQAIADDISVTNGGEIETIGNTSGGQPDRTSGIYYSGDGFTFVNESDGSIIAGGYHALTSGFNGSGLNPIGTSITNHGLLQSSDDVIRISQGSVLNTGTIETTGAAGTPGSGRSPDGISGFGDFDPAYVIPLSGLFDITNTASGVIEGWRAGISLFGGGTIDNDGDIIGQDTAISVAGAGQGSETTLTVLNAGLIESAGTATYTDERDSAAITISDYLELIGASITNSGVIRSANTAINSYVGVTLVNAASGSILSDSDNSNDDAIAFHGADYSDFALGVMIEFPTVGVGFPIISAQAVTVVGTGSLDTPVGTYDILSGQAPSASIFGRVSIDAPVVMALIDFTATQAAGNIVFQTDGDGDYIFPDEIEVTIAGYGVVTVRWLGDQNFAVEDASGDPVYILPAGLSLDDNIDNAGMMDGDVLTGAGDDLVTNDGHITGLIDLGSDNDTLNGAGALSAQHAAGGAGNDSISGGSSADSLSGDDGNDSLSGGGGGDTLDGGDGADLLNGGGAADTLSGGLGADTLIGGVGGDSLDGGDGDDVLDGGNGFDTLSGGAGNDMLLGGLADDRILGGTGNDTIDGGARHDVLLAGQAGDDSILGGIGDDSLTGGDDNDTLDGGGGDDTAGGGNGDDLLLGGAGDDLLNAGDGLDTIDGGNGNDRMAGAAGDDSMTGGAGNDVVKGNDGNDTLEGGNLNDTLNGGADNDLLDGGNNDDRLTGANGDDTLIGGSGNDTLLGNDGTDRLTGGTGDDTMTGHAGDDLFVFAVGDGVDVITDFTAGAASEDVIELSGFGAGLDEFAEVIAAASDDGTDTTIDLGGGQTITLLGVTVAELHQDDFLFS